MRAADDLANADGKLTFRVADQSYVGRKLDIDLPIGLTIGKKTITNLQVRNGISKDYVDELRQYPLVDDLLPDSIGPSSQRLGGLAADGSTLSAEFRVGSLFFSDVKFRS